MALTLRRLRLRAIWLIVLPFFWFARPSPAALAAGGMIASLGLAIRAWAAGTIRKNEALATTGPYRHTRNPLFLGSLLIGLGASISGGHWLWPALFLVFFATVYTKTIREEEARLEDLFGERYREYAAVTPSLFPGPGPLSTKRGPKGGAAEEEEGTSTGFTWERYRRNREWEALLGVIGAFGLLGAKLVF